MDTKKLRQKVLDLAIHGKLVKQDPNDEPASILLDRIRAEKARLVKEGKIKKSELNYDLISDVDYPFELPKGWTWVRLGELGEYRKGPFGSSLTKSMFVPQSPTSYKVYEQKNAINKDASLGNYYISEEKYYEMQGFIVKPDDIIVSCAGTIGETYIIPQGAPEGIINQALMRVRLYSKKTTRFWMLLFDFFTSLTSELDGNGTAIKNIPPFDVLKNINIPLPPLSEQHRIVKAVDELFEQIDIIERSEKELEEAANKTRDKLLNLAIQGHLVPQDPNEEPASVLLERIRAEKARLVKEGKLKKKDIEEKPISSDEIPFDIPEGWVWVRLSEIALDSADGPFGSNLKKEHYTDKREVRIIQLSNIGESGWKDANVKYTTFDYLPNIARSEAFAGDIIIAKMMPAGRAIICPDHEEKYVLSSDAVRFDFASNLDKKFLYYAINSSVFKNQVYSEVQGVTRVRTSLNKLRNYLLPLPPLNEQRRIVNKLEELLKEIDKLHS